MTKLIEDLQTLSRDTADRFEISRKRILKLQGDLNALKKSTKAGLDGVSEQLSDGRGTPQLTMAM